MKKVLIAIGVVLAGLGASYAQNADPALNLSTPSPVIALGSTTTVKIEVGNAGNDAIAAMSLEIVLTTGVNSQIMGLAPGSDPKWIITSLTVGNNNTVKLRNALGGYVDFDISEVILSVKGTVLGGPSTITAGVDYIPGPNVNLGGAPSATQGDAVNGNNNGTTSLIVSIPAPLHFSGFNVKDNSCSGVVTWGTTDEQNVKQFEIQQSYDGTNYTTVATVPSQGNGTHSYSATVGQSQKRMYYRVMALDLDGHKMYGTVLSLQLSNCTKAAIVQVYPIPVYRDQQITMKANVSDKIAYRLIDMNGKLVQTGMFTRNGQLKILNGGTYLLEMTSASFKETQTIVVQ